MPNVRVKRLLAGSRGKEVVTCGTHLEGAALGLTGCGMWGWEGKSTVKGDPRLSAGGCVCWGGTRRFLKVGLS